MHKRVRTLFYVVCVSLVSLPASSGVYRWVDENGVTVYSQNAPPAGDAVRIKPRPGPSAADQAAAQERLKAQLEQSMDAEEERRQAEEEQAKEAEQAAAKADACKAARANLETLQNLGNRMVRTADDRYLRLSEEEVAAKIKEAQTQVDEYCN